MDREESKTKYASLLSEARDFAFRLLDLQTGLDREGTVIEIKNNKRMLGANAWMLMCSIMIASLGLDLNSPAVIIGGMLISPLMAPILGVGLGVGTNDFETLRISLRHFLIAICIAIITSTLYFSLTPFGEPNHEILSRTKPTFLDVLIAFFGGVAGIISISRKDKSNAIPGVAIATALMPPLCVTGFGIANANFQIMTTSFYLFFLNSFFVAFSTYIIVRLLQFQSIVQLDEKGKLRKRLFVIFFSIFTILPSAYLLYHVLQNVRQKKNIDSFVKTYLGEDYKFVDDTKYITNDTVNRLILKVYGTEITRETLGDYPQAMADYGIENTELEIIPTTEIDLQKFQALESQVIGFERIAKQLEQTRTAKTLSDKRIDSLYQEINRLQTDTLAFSQVSRELKAIFPDIRELRFAHAQKTDFVRYVPALPVLLIAWEKDKSKASIQADEGRIVQFMKERTQIDTLEIIRHE